MPEEAIRENKPLMQSYHYADCKGRQASQQLRRGREGDADLLVHLAHCCNPLPATTSWAL